VDNAEHLVYIFDETIGPKKYDVETRNVKILIITIIIIIIIITPRRRCH